MRPILNQPGAFLRASSVAQLTNTLERARGGGDASVPGPSARSSAFGDSHALATFRRRH
jgi:hypothetical protein